VTLPGAELALPPAQVEELLTAFAKALRAHQLYLPNNPVYQKAIESVRDQFRRAFEATDDLHLEVAEGELRWEGTVVYSQSSRSESIAWVLFKDGVRSITFLAGFEQDEIVALLDVIHRARTLSAEANDDLLTLLWEKDFQRFRYQFQDLTADAGQMALPDSEELEESSSAQPRHVSQQVEEEAPPRAGIVRQEDFDTTLYFLDDKEIEYIRNAVQSEYAQDVRRNVLSMLFDVMELQPYPTVRAELISIMESFLPYLLGAADFPSVAYMLRECKAVLARARELLPEHRAALEKLPQRLSEEQALSQLLQSLDEASIHPTVEELSEVFGELRAEGLPTLFAWMPKLANAQVRQLVEGSAQRLAQANPATVVSSMANADVAVAVAAARTAGRMRLQSAVSGLSQLMGHPEAPARVAAVTALSEIASPAAIQALEKGLDDADRDVRLQSIRVIAQHKSRSALPRITNVVQGKSVRNADLTEKMAFFEAYGLLAGDAGVGPMDEILNSGGFLKRKEDPQTRACAAMALGKIASDRARAALEKAANDKEPLVRSAVGRALRGERASSLFRAGELPQ
jgi:hypothetical protein